MCFKCTFPGQQSWPGLSLLKVLIYSDFSYRINDMECQKFPATICSQFLFPDAWLLLTPTPYSDDTGLVDSLQIVSSFKRHNSVFFFSLLKHLLPLSSTGEKHIFRQFLICLANIWKCTFLCFLEYINTWKRSPKCGYFELSAKKYAPSKTLKSALLFECSKFSGIIINYK